MGDIIDELAVSVKRQKSVIECRNTEESRRLETYARTTAPSAAA